MFSIRSIVLIAAALAMGAESSAVPAVPAVAAAPLVAPAHVGYAHAVPQNIPPYATQVNTFSRALSPLVAAPVAGPYAAPYFAGPAPYALPAAAYAAPAPYAAPASYAAPAPYAASFPYAAPFPYAAAPLVRAPFGFAPAFVR